MRLSRVYPQVIGLVTILALETVGTASQPVLQTGGAPANVAAVSDVALNLAIQRSKTYIINACLPSGRFVYDIDDESGRILSKYNVIRHSGTIYSLGLYYESYPDPVVLNAMLRAGRFLKSTYISAANSDAGQGKILAIWSQPLGSVETPSASLGSLGLGLVALSEIEKLKPQLDSIDNLERIGRLILILQRKVGEFYGKFNNKDGPIGENDSLYYPGEAALGLISLYEVSRSDQWLVAAGKALSYLAKSREGQTQVPPDQWALIATARLLPSYPESKCASSQSELVQHAIQVCNCIMNEQIHYDPDPELNGGFDPSGRTTPSAVRIEGLLAALEFLPESQRDLRSKLEVTIRQGIQFLLRAQITKGRYLGGMPGTIQVDPVHQFRASEIRIDYVQHALCAFLRYQQFLTKHKSAREEAETFDR
jgi:hypothetical protein